MFSCILNESPITKYYCISAGLLLREHSMFAVLLSVPVVHQLHVLAAHVHTDAAGRDGRGLRHPRARTAK